MKKAVFLDRDGVINREQGWVYKLNDFEILPDVPNALKLLKDKGFLLIIITNQSGIGLGLYSHIDVETIHYFLADDLYKKKIKISEIYYCPHHPEKGKCLCRKPNTIMLEKAIARFNIDVKASYFIGDRDRDIEAANAVGLKSIKIESNSSFLITAGKIK